MKEIRFTEPTESPYVKRIITESDKEVRFVINIPPGSNFNWHILAVKKPPQPSDKQES